jgi:hypothetical protein
VCNGAKNGTNISEITFSKKLALIFSVSTSPTQPKSTFLQVFCALELHWHQLQKN